MDRREPPPRPDRPGALVLWPGASAGRDSPTLVACEAASPMPTTRAEFANPRGRTPVLLEEVGTVAAAAAEAAATTPDRVVLGGRSFGGRMCSMAVAGGLPAAGLVLLSYPLRPPGKPNRIRVEHLPAIAVPTLVVSGTRDPFGTPDELTEHLSTIRGPVTFTWIDGATHSTARRDDQVATAVATWLSTLTSPPPP